MSSEIKETSWNTSVSDNKATGNMFSFEIYIWISPELNKMCLLPLAVLWV